MKCENPNHDKEWNSVEDLVLTHYWIEGNELFHEDDNGKMSIYFKCRILEGKLTGFIKPIGVNGIFLAIVSLLDFICAVILILHVQILLGGILLGMSVINPVYLILVQRDMDKIYNAYQNRITRIGK